MAIRSWLRALVTAMAFAVASPSHAQTLTEDAFVALMHRQAADTVQLRDSIRLMYGTLPADHEEEMIRYAVSLYTDGEILGFYYRHLSTVLVDTIDPGYLFGMTAGISQAAITYGSLLLDPERQERLFAYNAGMAEWLLEIEPLLCVRFWVTNDLDAAQLSFLEFRYYEARPVAEFVPCTIFTARRYWRWPAKRRRCRPSPRPNSRPASGLCDCRRRCLRGVALSPPFRCRPARRHSARRSLCPRHRRLLRLPRSRSADPRLGRQATIEGRSAPPRLLEQAPGGTPVPQGQLQRATQVPAGSAPVCASFSIRRDRSCRKTRP